MIAFLVKHEQKMIYPLPLIENRQTPTRPAAVSQFDNFNWFTIP